MIYATSLPYTVPQPRGKQGGISGDGRLHALHCTMTGTVSDGFPGLILRYTFTGGVLDWRTGNMGTVVPLEGGTLYVQLASEPSAQDFGGGVTAEPQQIIVNGQGGAGFRWLPAGTIVSVLRDPDLGAGTVTVVGCMVEDYGQIATGDEFVTRQRVEAPALLFPTADGR